jgi:hypothetical protein
MRKEISVVSLFLCFSAMFAYTGAGLSPSLVYDTLDPSVTLLTPQPGEIWYVGQTRYITWTASDTNLVADSILVFYSLDDGDSYHPLAGPISNTGSYGFEIPDLTSDLARIRIIATDAFGNSSQAANPFILAYNPPLQVQHVEISANGPDAVITWDPVTGNINNEPVTPDGYMLFHSDCAPADPADYELLAITTGTTYTYLNAPQHDKKFFYVVAYLGSTGRLGSMLNGSRQGHRPRITMSDVKAYLEGLRLRGVE